MDKAIIECYRSFELVKEKGLIGAVIGGLFGMIGGAIFYTIHTVATGHGSIRGFLWEVGTSTVTGTIGGAIAP